MNSGLFRCSTWVDGGEESTGESCLWLARACAQKQIVFDVEF